MSGKYFIVKDDLNVNGKELTKVINGFSPREIRFMVKFHIANIGEGHKLIHHHDSKNISILVNILESRTNGEREGYLDFLQRCKNNGLVANQYIDWLLLDKSATFWALQCYRQTAPTRFPFIHDSISNFEEAYDQLIDFIDFVAIITTLPNTPKRKFDNYIINLYRPEKFAVHGQSLRFNYYAPTSNFYLFLRSNTGECVLSIPIINSDSLLKKDYTVYNVPFIRDLRSFWTQNKTPSHAIDWINIKNEVQITWAIEYLIKKNYLILNDIFTPLTIEDKYNLIIASIEFLSDDEKFYTTRNMAMFEKEHKKIQGQDKEVRQKQHLKQLTLRASFLRSMKKAWIEFNADIIEDRTFELSKKSFKKLATLAKQKNMSPQTLLKELIEESSVQPSIEPKSNIEPKNSIRTSKLVKTHKIMHPRAIKK